MPCVASASWFSAPVAHWTKYQAASLFSERPETARLQLMTTGFEVPDSRPPGSTSTPMSSARPSCFIRVENSFEDSLVMATRP